MTHVGDASTICIDVRQNYIYFLQKIREKTSICFSAIYRDNLKIGDEIEFGFIYLLLVLTGADRYIKYCQDFSPILKQKKFNNFAIYMKILPQFESTSLLEANFKMADEPGST